MNKYIISSLILLSCTLHAIESKIEVRHREAGGVGYSTGYTSLDYFLMAHREGTEFLLDLRGHVFNNGQGAANAGLGFRCPVKDDKFLVGGNLFYDLRQSPHLFCNQIGAGVEWLTQNVDVRFNGYVPLGKIKHFETHTFVRFASKSVLIKHKLKAALPSIEGEVGTPLPRPFYFAVGSYYLFTESKHHLGVGGALGGRVRADVDLGRYVTLGLSITYDHIFKTRAQGIFSINIPFEKKKINCAPKKKTDCTPPEKKRRNLYQVPIMRNEIIPIQDKRNSHDPLLAVDGTPLSFLFVDNLAAIDGDGSFERPFAILKDAEKKSAPGDIIYVFAGDRTPKNMDEGIVLKKDQILASSGQPLIIRDIIIPPHTPGINPSITNIHQIDNPATPIVANPGNTHLDDFFFIPPWDYIFGRGFSDTGSAAAIDPFADARAAGFEPIGASAVDPDLADFQVIPPDAPPPAPGWNNPFAIIGDYMGGSK